MPQAFLVLAALLVAGCAGSPKPTPGASTSRLAPPVAAVHPHSITVHGDTRVDDYAWLRDKGSPDVISYLEAENAYAEARMVPTKELQEALYQEIVGRIQETDQSAPYRKGSFEYYQRTTAGSQYPIHCRRVPGKEETEQILLDMNALAEGRPFLGLGLFEVSPDGNYLAFALDETGFREYVLQIKDLRSGNLVGSRIEKVRSLAWASDSETFFYTVDDDSKRPHEIWRHVLGRSAEDELVYREDDERFIVAVWRSRSGEYVFRGAFSHTTSEIGFVSASKPRASWRTIAKRRQDHEYEVEHRRDHFLIRTNDRGRNFRVVRAPVSSPGPASWKELVAHRPDVMIESLNAFDGFYVMLERERGLPYLRVVRFRDGDSHRVAIEEPVYTLYPGDNEEFDSNLFRFHYESLTTPDSVFDYDVNAKTRVLVKEVEVLGGYAAAQYSSERLWAIARDGTEVPVSLVYRRGTPRDGSAPMLLVGYGAYGYPYPTGFSHARVSLLDRGMIYAIAHVRGGGELGKAWHDAGRMAQKMNSFTDFIDVSEHLLNAGYTSSDRLAIEGGSAGGLLMGAVVNLRPDLFAAVVSLVPFVDVLNTMLDASLPLTVGEYEEWGNPNDRDAYFRIKAYCPYTNIRADAYPAMLVRSSINDSQVMYWEPAKYVAKLRALKIDDNPLLFKINMGAGHGGASGRYDYLKDTALDYAFILTQVK